MIQIDLIITLIFGIISGIIFVTEKGFRIRKTIKESQQNDTDIKWAEVFLLDE